MGTWGLEEFPLPACAYHMIRKEFSVEGVDFTGYEDDENWVNII